MIMVDRFMFQHDIVRIQEGQIDIVKAGVTCRVFSNQAFTAEEKYIHGLPPRLALISS
jgi:hypothetical protein